MSPPLASRVQSLLSRKRPVGRRNDRVQVVVLGNVIEPLGPGAERIVELIENTQGTNSSDGLSGRSYQLKVQIRL